MEALVVQAWEGPGLADGAARLLPHLEIHEAINNIAVKAMCVAATSRAPSGWRAPWMPAERRWPSAC